MVNWNPQLHTKDEIEQTIAINFNMDIQINISSKNKM